MPLLKVLVADARGKRQNLAIRSKSEFVLDQTAKATTVRLKRVERCRDHWIRVEGSAPFQVAGRNSTAVPRGTRPARWTTTERCDGTVTTVLRGTVVVHDGNRRISVDAGERHFAGAAKR